MRLLLLLVPLFILFQSCTESHHYDSSSLHVENNSGSTISAFYLTPNYDHSWGYDELGSGYLYSGETLNISGLESGYYDYQAIFTDLTVIEGSVYLYDHDLVVVNFEAPPLGNISISNTGVNTIMEIYASPITSSDWGDDRLGNSVLYPGDNLILHGLDVGSWDVQVIFDDNAVITQTVSVQNGQTTALGMADTVTIPNGNG